MEVSFWIKWEVELTIFWGRGMGNRWFQFCIYLYVYMYMYLINHVFRNCNFRSSMRISEFSRLRCVKIAIFIETGSFFLG